MTSLQPGAAGSGTMMFHIESDVADERIEVWDLDAAEMIWSHEFDGTLGLHESEMSRDASTLAWVGKSEREWRCYYARLDAEGEVEDCTPDGNPIRIDLAGISHDGRIGLMWSGLDPMQVGVFENGTHTAWWTDTNGEYIAVGASGITPDGSAIYLDLMNRETDENFFARVDSSGTMTPVYTYPEGVIPGFEGNRAFISDDGQRVLYTVKEIELRDSSMTHDLSTNETTIYDTQFANLSPDGSQIAGRSHDNEPVIHDFGEVSPAQTLAEGTWFTWSPDGSRIAHRVFGGDYHFDIFTAPASSLEDRIFVRENGGTAKRSQYIWWGE